MIPNVHGLRVRWVHLVPWLISQWGLFVEWWNFCIVYHRYPHGTITIVLCHSIRVEDWPELDKLTRLLITQKFNQVLISWRLEMHPKVQNSWTLFLNCFDSLTRRPDQNLFGIWKSDWWIWKWKMNSVGEVVGRSKTEPIWRFSGASCEVESFENQRNPMREGFQEWVLNEEFSFKNRRKLFRFFRIRREKFFEFSMGILWEILMRILLIYIHSEI